MCARNFSKAVQRRHVLSGMGIGLLTGIASGALGGVLLLGSYGSAYGIVVGGVAGSLIRTDVWEAVHDPRWRVSVRPTSGRGAALTLSF